MKITQIRSATLILETTEKTILVDPMLAKMGALPRLRYFKSNQRNPLVELPKKFNQLETQIDCALITHCQKGHFDHLDRAGVRWLKKHNIETFCTKHDYNYLTRKGIHTRQLPENSGPFLNGSIQLILAKHTTGWLTPFIEHGVGYFIQQDNEPSLYLMGDTILTNEIREFIHKNQPDYIVAPTGMAKLDIGAPLLLNEKEIIELATLCHGIIIANHMDALDHCRISRKNLKAILGKQRLENRFIIPEDGETIDL